jgi:ATPase family associated with various cellular activities (AAA)
MTKQYSKIQNNDSKTIYSNRTFNYLDVGGLCWYLYKKDGDIRIPSIRYINSVDGEKIIEFLSKHATLLGDGKVLDRDTSKDNEKPIRYHISFLDQDDDGSSFVFNIAAGEKINGIEIKEPIILKVNNERKTWYLGASSFDSQNLQEFVNFLYKNYSKKEDYDNQTFFGILMNTGDSIEIKQVPIDDKFSKNLDIDINYGTDFFQHHKNIIEKITKNSNGLFLFHGSAGTGKTTYIKYLAKYFGGKRMFIFIPTSFIDTLVSPNLIPILLEHPNSVLVLEDAEKAVVSREEGHGNESLVSSLLNIGDGILGSMLNLTIILTFNTGRDNIDKALLRKGRLHYEHEFGKLNVGDAQALVDKIGKNVKVTERMSLAEIYNLENDNNHKEKERGKIGFGV